MRHASLVESANGSIQTVRGDDGAGRTLPTVDADSTEEAGKLAAQGRLNRYKFRTLLILLGILPPMRPVGRTTWRHVLLTSPLGPGTVAASAAVRDASPIQPGPLRSPS